MKNNLYIALAALGISMQAMSMGQEAPQAPDAPGNAPTSLTATSAAFGPRRYQGKVISAASIIKLAPPAPKEVAESVAKFFTDNDGLATNQGGLTGTLLGFEPMIGSVKQSHEASNKILADMGKPNKSDWNYVFEAISGYMVYVAGHVNRRENLTVTATDYFQKHHPYALLADGTPGRWLTQDDYAAFEKGLVEQEFDRQSDETIVKTAPKTYQTISRMAHWLLFKQAQLEGKIPANVIVPDMHLVHIPSRSEEVSDRNYVVISRKNDGLQEVTSLTAQETEAIDAAIKAVGLFGCNKGGLKRTADGKLVLLDLEQPNNSAPKLFFHKADWKFKQNVNAGQEDFIKHFATARIAGAVEAALPEFKAIIKDPASIAALIGEYAA